MSSVAVHFARVFIVPVFALNSFAYMFPAKSDRQPPAITRISNNSNHLQALTSSTQEIYFAQMVPASGCFCIIHSYRAVHASISFGAKCLVSMSWRSRLMLMVRVSLPFAGLPSGSLTIPGKMM